MASLHRLLSLVPLLLLIILSAQNLGSLEAEARNVKNPTKLLFAFGDSYADTGNVRRDAVASSWKQPYGITFPGIPAGRFSNGRVLTDFLGFIMMCPQLFINYKLKSVAHLPWRQMTYKFLNTIIDDLFAFVIKMPTLHRLSVFRDAKYLGVRSPVPYRMRNLMPQYMKYGINFAYGGTGVFNTFSADPNMTLQIDFFQALIRDKVYSSAELRNSVALVSVAGNDYSFYLQRNGATEVSPKFMASVVKQMVKNVARIHALGVKKIAVSGLQPVGCLPKTTALSSFSQCNSTFNDFATSHNNLLRRGLVKLKQQETNNDNSSIVILDLYDSFMSVLNHPSSYKIKNHFKPCCVGLSSQYACGSVDDKSMVKKYRVCNDPKSAFFWDLVHPTQSGWHAVYSNLRATSNVLQQLH